MGKKDNTPPDQLRVKYKQELVNLFTLQWQGGTSDNERLIQTDNLLRKCNKYSTGQLELGDLLFLMRVQALKSTLLMKLERYQEVLDVCGKITSLSDKMRDHTFDSVKISASADKLLEKAQNDEDNSMCGWALQKLRSSGKAEHKVKQVGVWSKLEDYTTKLKNEKIRLFRWHLRLCRLKRELEHVDEAKNEYDKASEFLREEEFRTLVLKSSHKEYILDQYKIEGGKLKDIHDNIQLVEIYDREQTVSTVSAATSLIGQGKLDSGMAECNKILTMTTSQKDRNQVFELLGFMLEKQGALDDAEGCFNQLNVASKLKKQAHADEIKFELQKKKGLALVAEKRLFAVQTARQLKVNDSNISDLLKIAKARHQSLYDHIVTSDQPCPWDKELDAVDFFSYFLQKIGELEESTRMLTEFLDAPSPKEKSQRQQKKLASLYMTLSVSHKGQSTPDCVALAREGAEKAVEISRGHSKYSLFREHQAKTLSNFAKTEPNEETRHLIYKKAGELDRNRTEANYGKSSKDVEPGVLQALKSLLQQHSLPTTGSAASASNNRNQRTNFNGVPMGCCM